MPQNAEYLVSAVRLMTVNLRSVALEERILLHPLPRSHLPVLFLCLDNATLFNPVGLPWYFIVFRDVTFSSLLNSPPYWKSRFCGLPWLFEMGIHQ